MKIRCKNIASGWIDNYGYYYSSTINNQVYDISENDWEKQFPKDDYFPWWNKKENFEGYDTLLETIYSLVEDDADECDEKVLKIVRAWENDIISGHAMTIRVKRG